MKAILFLDYDLGGEVYCDFGRATSGAEVENGVTNVKHLKPPIKALE